VLAIDMESQQPTTFIPTKLGKIAVYQQFADSDKTPIIFLHGVYFDHHLWDAVIESIKDRTIITLDMPMHGMSNQLTKNDWTLADCADMLIEILHGLQLPKVIAIGHSWGSMTILRAAHKNSKLFSAIGLCNMPFMAASKGKKLTLSIQHVMLPFRNFYTQQAAKALFGTSSLNENTSLTSQLRRTMNLLTIPQIKHTDRAVIANAENTSALMKTLKVKALALKGEEDYVPAPPYLETIIVKGGHVSPLENPNGVIEFVKRILFGVEE
jgi:pimeloyl-ACP methyl ester carboxylesterase